MDYRLRKACFDGNLEYIKQRIEKNKFSFQHYKEYHINPIYLCACKGKLECIKYLINIIPISLETIVDCIKMSTTGGHYYTVEFLISISDGIENNNPRIVYALAISINKGYRQIARLLIESGLGMDCPDCHPFLFCAEVGDLDTMELLVQKFPKWYQYGKIAFSIAMERKKTKIVDFLTGKGIGCKNCEKIEFKILYS